MDAAFRKWFSRRKARDRSGKSQFKSQPYDSAEASAAPYEGSFPVAGNGPVSLEGLHARYNASRQSLDAAAPPNIQRRRRYSETDRPLSARSASRSIPFKSYGRRHSASSLDASRKPIPQFTWKYTRSPSPAQTTSSLLNRDQVRSISAFAIASLPPQSSHVDLLDALSNIKPSPQTHIQKIKASGRRDYGEDVADRNLATFGGGELDSVQYHSHSAFPDRTFVLKRGTVAGGMRGSRQFKDRSGPAWDPPALRFSNDATGDDTTRSKYSATSYYAANHQYFLSPPTLRPAIPPTGPRYGNVNNYNNAAPKRALSAKSIPGSTNTPPPVIAYQRPSSITSSKSYFLPRRWNNSPFLNEPERPASTQSHRLRKFRPLTPDNQAAQITVAPIQASSEPIVRPAYANSGTQTDPVPEPRYAPQDSSSVSQMSPTTTGSSNTSTPRASLDKALPPTPDSRLHGSRQQEYSRRAYEPQSSRTSEDSDAAFPPNIRKQIGRVDNDTSKPSLPDGFNLSNTTDTEVTTHVRPAVIHEHVTPKVHEIIEKRITREIHTHDVFHRIQPIIDVEILPTKHYVPAPNGNGLVEVPASAIPGRHTEWEVRPVEKDNFTSKSSQRDSLETSHSLPSGREPVLESEEKTITSDGIPRVEKLWRHPAELETGGQRAGQTVPINMDHPTVAASDTTDDFVDAWDQQSAYTTGEGEVESELLFKDSDHAFDGALPGLEERNPVVAKPAVPVHPASSSSERVPSQSADVDEEGVGQATRALRRRQAEVTRKMEEMSVRE